MVHDKKWTNVGFLDNSRKEAGTRPLPQSTAKSPESQKPESNNKTKESNNLSLNTYKEVYIRIFNLVIHDY